MNAKEIVIISGKGGTGKTSIAASFAHLAAGSAVVADCDVDAADLHLILKPDMKTRTEFRSGRRAVIVPDKCTGCGICADVCRFGAIVNCAIDPVACEGCGVCVRFCPVQAIDFPEQVCGEWYISGTRFGALVHARLGIAAENSGRLVTLVRSEAKRIAGEQGLPYVIIDGSPGIGCPVIASLTASDIALIVTEPTVSGDHDLRRIAQLTRKLGIPALVCVNKWDINPDATDKIKLFAREADIGFAGVISYDKAVTAAQRAGQAVTEYSTGGVAKEIRSVWDHVKMKGFS